MHDRSTIEKQIGIGKIEMPRLKRFGAFDFIPLELHLSQLFYKYALIVCTLMVQGNADWLRRKAFITVCFIPYYVHAESP